MVLLRLLVAKILDEMTVRPISFQRDKRVQTRPRSEHKTGLKARAVPVIPNVE